MDAFCACLSDSTCFNNYAVGIGALLAGGAGLRILLDWSSNKIEINRRNKLREELRVRYPVSKHGQTFQLIETDFPLGWVYLHDKKLNKKHHVASMLTLIKLGYNRNQVKKLSQKDFDLIDEREEFLTDGERYS